jgi:hypothetical protein
MNEGEPALAPNIGWDLLRLAGWCLNLKPSETSAY